MFRGRQIMPGRRKNRARRRRARRQKLKMMARIKNGEKEQRSKSPQYSCSEGDMCNISSDSTSPENTHSLLLYTNETSESGMESKENLEPVVADKRKIEFSPKRITKKQNRTSSLCILRKKELNWPEKNSSTSCLTSWLDAAEDIFISSPSVKEITKTKRSRDEVAHCGEDVSPTSRPVKKTKSVQINDQMMLSSESATEMMEISPVLTSSKRTRHNSSPNSSLIGEDGIVESSECTTMARPTKRTKSISEKPSKSPDELSECVLSSSKESNTITASVECIPASPVSSHATLTSDHRPSSAPQLRSLKIDAEIFGSLQLRDETSSTSSVPTETTYSVPSSITITDVDDDDEECISSTVPSHAQATLYEKESESYIRSVMWKLLSLGLMRSSRRRVRWPTTLSVSKMMEICMWICTKVICWVEISVKTIRKSFISMRNFVISVDQLGKTPCCSCGVTHAHLERKLTALENDLARLQEMHVDQKISALEKELAALRGMLSSKDVNYRTESSSSVPPPPPPPPPPPILFTQNNSLKLTMKKEDPFADKQISRVAITVEDIRKVQLKKTPSTTLRQSRSPAVTNRGPVVSLEMLRSVKLRSSQQRRRSAERNKSVNRFPFDSPRDAQTFSRILRNVDTNVVSSEEKLPQ